MALIIVIIFIIAVYFFVTQDSKPKYIEPKIETYTKKPVGKYISDFEVVGIHALNIKTYIINSVILNNPVELIPEPTNTYSKKAIQVKIDGTYLGYISEDDVDEVHEIIKNPYLAWVSYKSFEDDYLTLEIEINHD